MSSSSTSYRLLLLLFMCMDRSSASCKAAIEPVKGIKENEPFNEISSKAVGEILQELQGSYTEIECILQCVPLDECAAILHSDSSQSCVLYATYDVMTPLLVGFSFADPRAFVKLHLEHPFVGPSEVLSSDEIAAQMRKEVGGGQDIQTGECTAEELQETTNTPLDNDGTSTVMDQLNKDSSTPIPSSTPISSPSTVPANIDSISPSSISSSSPPAKLSSSPTQSPAHIVSTPHSADSLSSSPPSPSHSVVTPVDRKTSISDKTFESSTVTIPSEGGNTPKVDEISTDDTDENQKSTMSIKTEKVAASTPKLTEEPIEVSKVTTTKGEEGMTSSTLHSSSMKSSIGKSTITTVSPSESTRLPSTTSSVSDRSSTTLTSTSVSTSTHPTSTLSSTSTSSTTSSISTMGSSTRADIVTEPTTTLTTTTLSEKDKKGETTQFDEAANCTISMNGSVYYMMDGQKLVVLNSTEIQKTDNYSDTVEYLVVRNEEMNITGSLMVECRLVIQKDDDSFVELTSYQEERNITLAHVVSLSCDCGSLSSPAQSSATPEVGDTTSISDQPKDSSTIETTSMTSSSSPSSTTTSEPDVIVTTTTTEETTSSSTTPLSSPAPSTPSSSTMSTSSTVATTSTKKGLRKKAGTLMTVPPDSVSTTYVFSGEYVNAPPEWKTANRIHFALEAGCSVTMIMLNGEEKMYINNDPKRKNTDDHLDNVISAYGVCP